MQIEFSESERSTVGVEWELALVDRRTRDLVRSAISARLPPFDGRSAPWLELLRGTPA